MSQKAKRQKHNYTSELELKTLLIRIKNKRQQFHLTTDHNSRINKYVKWYIKLSNQKYATIAQKTKKTNLKRKLKQRAIELSEITAINTESYENFGRIIMLMIKNILKKPQFSGYTYRDDFYSDAIHKILKYLCNFNHKLISDITNQPVNSFAYISQIIHNSVLFIINIKKKELNNIKHQISMEILDHNYDIKDYERNNHSTYDPSPVAIEHNIVIDVVKHSLYDSLVEIQDEFKDKEGLIVKVTYPEDYSISFEEFDQIKPLLKGNISICRKTSM